MAHPRKHSQSHSVWRLWMGLRRIVRALAQTWMPIQMTTFLEQLELSARIWRGCGKYSCRRHQMSGYSFKRKQTSVFEVQSIRNRMKWISSSKNKTGNYNALPPSTKARKTLRSLCSVISEMLVTSCSTPVFKCSKAGRRLDVTSGTRSRWLMMVPTHKR